MAEVPESRPELRSHGGRIGAGGLVSPIASSLRDSTVALMSADGACARAFPGYGKGLNTAAGLSGGAWSVGREAPLNPRSAAAVV